MVNLKACESMTISERKDQTLRDLRLREKRRLEQKKRAEYDARSFVVESSMKSIARSRSAKNRGCRSCR